MVQFKVNFVKYCFTYAIVFLNNLPLIPIAYVIQYNSVFTGALHK